MEEKEISEIKEVNEVKETATQTKNYDEAYCHSCGKVIKKEAFVLPKTYWSRYYIYIIFLDIHT